jgi:hypothetical protein
MINKISFNKRPDEYMRILDSGIEYYKTQLSLTTQSIIFTCTTLISFLLAYFGAYISIAILPNYVKDPLQLSLISIIITLLVLSSIFLTNSNKLIIGLSKVIGKKVGTNEMLELKTKLNRLYLAKIEPEKWDLKVTIDRENNLIRDIEIEKAETKSFIGIILESIFSRHKKTGD